MNTDIIHGNRRGIQHIGIGFQIGNELCDCIVYIAGGCSDDIMVTCRGQRIIDKIRRADVERVVCRDRFIAIGVAENDLMCKAVVFDVFAALDPVGFQIDFNTERFADVFAQTDSTVGFFLVTAVGADDDVDRGIFGSFCFCGIGCAVIRTVTGTYGKEHAEQDENQSDFINQMFFHK